MAIPPEPLAGDAATTVHYKGVRKRKWGKWVSEVRLPNSRERIWLGSYDSPEKAALAFDAASFLLRGPRASLNFPDRVQEIAVHCGGHESTPQQIQVAAASYAYATTPPPHVIEQVLSEVEKPASAAEKDYVEQLRASTVFPAMDEFGYERLQQVETAEQQDLWTENNTWFSSSSSWLWNF